MRGVLKALATFPDGKRVQHFLPAIVPGTATRVSTGNAATGPKNDLSAVREWARKNGFPDVKDRGRMSDEILDAYNKAQPFEVMQYRPCWLGTMLINAGKTLCQRV